MYHALQILGSVESLLLLEEEHIAGYGNTANGLAVGSASSQHMCSMSSAATTPASLGF
jgi:hypothetical protein